MSLEVHIYGPGFGETIFLRWPKAGGGWHGALVDAHCPRGGEWLAGKLRELELTELEFVVATHPHLDHIRNFAAGLHRSEVSVAQGFYWPGLSASYALIFFGRLADQNPEAHLETAKMIRQWFGYWGPPFKKDRPAPRDLGGASDFPVVYSTTADGSPLRVKAIGPWLEGINRFVKNVSTSIGRRGKIDYEHREANAVSIALLIEYGDAQIVLGGDMEEVNWEALQREFHRPKFQPSLVKVSHHGSPNGRINGMWPSGIGFFDGKGEKPIAVVTPWHQAGGKLPNGNAVLNEIRGAGFTVYVTGEGSPRYKDLESHVSIRLNPDRTAPVVFDQFKVRTV